MNFEIDYNDFFNRNYSSSAVTCITDNEMISRICYETDYHVDTLATMLTYLTGYPYKNTDLMYKDEKDRFYTFIRYVVAEDSVDITIELPKEMSKTAFSNLESVAQEWKNAKENVKKNISFYLMDEEFNIKYNPELDEMDISKIDIALDYIKNVKYKGLDKSK